MKLITPDLIISLCVSVLLCGIFYFINKNSDPNNSIKLKVYVKWCLSSTFVLFSVLYITKKYSTDAFLPSLVTSQTGGSSHQI